MARSKVRRLALCCLSLPSSYLLWIVFTGTFSLHELLVGIGGALLAASGMFVVNLQYPARFSPSISDLVAFWRLPWYLLSGTWEIALVATKDALRIKRAQSLFRVVSFDAGKSQDPHANARRVLAVAYTTIAPDCIVLGVNNSNNTLLIHQFERRPVGKMMRQLGARP